MPGLDLGPYKGGLSQALGFTSQVLSAAIQFDNPDHFDTQTQAGQKPLHTVRDWEITIKNWNTGAKKQTDNEEN